MGKLIQLLSAATGLSDRDVRRIVRNAPVRYKTYQIPKRRGGVREIHHPARELKLLQRALVDEVLQHLPVHSSAMAYRVGLSIKDNAEAHARSGAILKFDFKEFFPSIVSGDWDDYCRRNGVFSDQEDILVSRNILFRAKSMSSRLRLAIGAPSSPMLSNILMYDFDRKIADAVTQDYVIYTRYADDLTFSARRTGYLNGVEKTLKKILREQSHPRLKINPEKTVLATKKYRRVVTGLVISNQGAVSIGHEKKKYIRAAVHHASLGLLSYEEKATLAGMLSFVRDVEPSFYERLALKYGLDILAAINVRLGERPVDDSPAFTSDSDAAL